MIWNMVFSFLLQLLKRLLERESLSSRELSNVAKFLAVAETLKRESKIEPDTSFEPMVEAYKRKWSQ